MIVGVPRESYPGERRVALTPAVIPTLTKTGVEVVIEAAWAAESVQQAAEMACLGGRVVLVASRPRPRTG